MQLYVITSTVGSNLIVALRGMLVYCYDFYNQDTLARAVHDRLGNRQDGTSFFSNCREGLRTTEL